MRRERILIVDDEADIALILKLQLEDAGYVTERARDGVEALDSLARDGFDLTLLDIKMPRLDGMQVLARVRNDYQDLAVVMMTAHGSEDVAVAAMKQGAIDYIAKPFSTDDMLKRVERAIQYNRTRLENLRLARELEEERRKMAAVLQGMADLLVAVDSSGRVMTVNRQLELSLARERDLLLGCPVEEVLAADLSPERLPCRVVLATGAPCLDVAYNLKLPDRSVPVLSSATPLLDGEGELMGSVEILRDISTLRALEQEREDFVSMLSHDLKTPITAVVGSIDLVREGRLGSVNDEQCEYLESAVESCTEMTEMIDTLLDVHKFEAGRMALNFRQEDLPQLVQKVLARFRPMARRSQVQLEADFAPELPDVRIDRTKFARLLNNLLSNAFKFTPEGGRVAVGGEALADIASVRERIPAGLYSGVSVPEHGAFCRVTVRDSGVGIPAAALVTIFDRFVQAKNRRQGKSTGTGLGLAFCRKVMDAHGGFIWAESEVGRGSEFHLLFPLPTSDGGDGGKG